MDGYTDTQLKLLSNECLLTKESDKLFFQNIHKQGWCSERQEAILNKILKKTLSFCGKDMDEWWDSGYRDYPGQYDGGY